MFSRIPPYVVSTYLIMLFLGVLYFLVTFRYVTPQYQFTLFLFLIELMTILFLHLIELQRKKPWGPEPQYEQTLLMTGVSFCPFLLASLNTASSDRVGLMRVFDGLGINLYLTGVSGILLFLMLAALGIIICAARKQGPPVALFSASLTLYALMISMKAVQSAGSAFPDHYFFLHVFIPTLVAGLLWASIPRIPNYDKQQDHMSVLLCVLILVAVLVYLKFYAQVDVVYHIINAISGTQSFINPDSMMVFLIILGVIAALGVTYLFFEALFTGKIIKGDGVKLLPAHKFFIAGGFLVCLFFGLYKLEIFGNSNSWSGNSWSTNSWDNTSSSSQEYYAVQIGVFKHNYNVNMSQLCYKNTEIFRMVPSNSRCDILQSYLVADINELYRLMDITKASCPGVQSPVILLYDQYKNRTHVWDDQRGDWVYSPEENLRNLRGC